MPDFSRSTSTKEWAVPHMSDCGSPTCVLGEHDRHTAHDNGEGVKWFEECWSHVDESQWGGQRRILVENVLVGKMEYVNDPVQDKSEVCPEGNYGLHMCIKTEEHDDPHVCACGQEKARTD